MKWLPPFFLAESKGVWSSDCNCNLKPFELVRQIGIGIAEVAEARDTKQLGKSSFNL